MKFLLSVKITKSCAYPDVPEDVLDPGLAVLDDQEVPRPPGLGPDVLVLDVHIGQEAGVPGPQVGEDGDQLLCPPAAHTELARG